ncbi:PaaX family transcriptional regulator C-terminal domain-containing protein [Spirochaeta isovalerica]|uniref:Phenylacetic acid degradation operon negative regulatory protein n=1 Tax=Spirochaeta isovalerica TaxID=150 RepID=A0A841RGB1_9SPIO|nr:phenylacetic acid degradation operon negative regulatory protein [Spirochaeta isovalerica]
MIDSDLIFGIMASMGEGQYSVSRLMYLTSPFSMSDTSLRTALSRMAARGIVMAEKRGRKAFYTIVTRGKRIGANVALSFAEPDWSSWDGRWWGFLYSLPSAEKALRHRLRTKLEAHRFVSFYPGCWIRPFREEEKIKEKLSGFSVSVNGRLVLLTFPDELTAVEVGGLWQLDSVNDALGRGIKLIEQSERSLERTDPAGAFRLKMETGDQVVKILFGDPLLPPCYLPENWAGGELRRRFTLWEKQVNKAAASFAAGGTI